MFENTLKVLLLTSTTLFSQYIFAENYYWRVTGSTIQFPSASSSCQHAFQTSTYANRPDAGIETTPSGSTAYRCELYYYNAMGFYTKSLLALTNLRGNSCPTGTTFQNSNPALPVCAPAEVADINGQQKGYTQFCGANGIEYAVGNKFHTERDYIPSGNSSLEFQRFYNSMDGKWSHTYSTSLDISQDGATAKLTIPSGKESYFTINNSIATSTSGDRGILSRKNNSWEYLSTSNEYYNFDINGKLTSQTNSNGITASLSYSLNSVTVTDSLGNSISYTLSNDQKITSLTTPNQNNTYTYTSSAQLTSATKAFTSGTAITTYHYEDSRDTTLLTGITDASGQRHLTWTYDSKGRVTSEQITGGGSTDIQYNNDGSTSVTSASGKITRYQFEEIQGGRYVTEIIGEPSQNCPSSNSSFTYNEQALPLTKTNNKGFLTTYIYNSRGLETSRTEATGTVNTRTTTTAWHPTLFLPITITEPNRVTQYTYDAQGRQTGKSIDPL